MGWLNYLIAPGFLQTSQVRSALILGTAVAVCSAVMGVFVIIRGQAFLGHALGDVGSTGASGAVLVGVQAIWGFLGAGLIAGASVDVLSRRARERDVATGVVLSAMLGLSALFIYLIGQVSTSTGVTQEILFGSVFTVNPDLVLPMVGLALAAVVVVGFVYRPLLLSTVNPDGARSRGVPVGLVSFAFLVAMVAAVEQSALVMGALLSTALLIGPAATAIHVTRRLGMTIAVSVVLALVDTWLGILLAYDSFNWPPAGRGWPVSFFVVAVMVVAYSLGQAVPRTSTVRAE
ncbi:MAG: metal ABC transporter permease [Candidatus Dormibacteraeota bacterium]|nr:metal ABC transporter permease [Candidatus Dormibacteraeota bacterium]